MLRVNKCIFLLLLFLQPRATLFAQVKTFDFKIKVDNESGFTSYCYIPGNEQIDSILAGQNKLIQFKQPLNQQAFYLVFSTADTASTSYHQQVFRIFKGNTTRSLKISPENSIKFIQTAPEKIVNEFKPGLRTRNFWKLDSIIRLHHDNVAAADIIYLSLCDTDVPVDTIRYYQSWLSERIQTSPFGARIRNYITARSRLIVGKKLPLFSLPDSSKRLCPIVPGASEYILIDFWFSRCAPCLRSFPEMKQLYDSSRRSNLEIIGISVDTKQDNKLWKSTIVKYGLTWPNLNDSKSVFTNEMLAIVNFPTRVLIDRNRNILLVDNTNSDDQFFEKVKMIINR